MIEARTETMTTDNTAVPAAPGRLMRYLDAVARHRYAAWVLAAIAFADSSFLPLAPDLLLVPMVLVQPQRMWSLSLLCTVASTLGAALGYFIGWGLWNLIGAPLVEFYGYSHGFATYQHWVEEWGVWLVIAKGLTPIPFKIIAIAAGVAKMNLLAFMIATVIGRSLHFAMVAGLVYLLGDRLMMLVAKFERKFAFVSVVVLLVVGVAVYLHAR
jgi:membrane protein YqaA with SNARE-associated domain